MSFSGGNEILMNESCPYCGASLPSIGDALCPICHREMADPATPPDAGAIRRISRAAEFQHTLTVLTPRVYVTWVLLGVNVLVFVLMAASGVSPMEPDSPDLLRWGADFAPLTTNGEWWRMLTSTFVHIGVIHIALNMWVLAAAGPLVERMVGNVGFAVLYLVAGLTGSLASLLWNPHHVSAGASGAIFGIYGAMLGLLLRGRGSIPAEALAQLRNSGLGFLFYNLLYGMMHSRIDNAAHIGGLVGGFLCGLVLGQPLAPAARAGRPVRNVFAGGLGVVLGLAGVMALHGRYPDVPLLLGDKVGHGNIDVLYSDGATRPEGERLAPFLSQIWGGTSGPFAVQLKKAAEGYRVRVKIKKELQNDRRVLQGLQLDAARISSNVFDGAPTDIQVCDSDFNTLHNLSPRADLRHVVAEGKAEVYYGGNVRKGDAQRLAECLAQLQEGVPGEAKFKLARRGAVVEVHVVLDPEKAKDPVLVAGLQQYRTIIATKVFPGATVELHLCDDQLNDLQIFRP
jgi:membrane associated rhomboid family serine protease